MDNLPYDSLRKAAFDYARETKQYALAEKLAVEKGIPTNRTYGVPNWGELLFRVYKESGNTEEMRSLAKTGNLA